MAEQVKPKLCQQAKRYDTLSTFYSRDVQSKVTLINAFPTWNLGEGNTWIQKKKFPVFDYPPNTKAVNKLRDYRTMVIAGKNVRLVLDEAPIEELKNHWKKWIPYYEDPEIIEDHSEDALNDVKDGTLFPAVPLEWAPKEKHFMDVDVLHKIHSKVFITEIPCKQPKSMSEAEATAPCVIKVPNSWGSMGTFIARTDQQKKKYEQFIRETKYPQKLVYQEIIEDIASDVCIHFYLCTNGDVNWDGVTEQVYQGKYYMGGDIEWDQQDKLVEKYSPVCKPVMDALHNNGFYGVGCIDILEDKKGDQFIVDVNPRLGGPTAQHFLAPLMADMGYKYTTGFISHNTFAISARDAMKKIEALNNEGNGLIIVIGITDDGVNRCKANFNFAGHKREHTSHLVKQCYALLGGNLAAEELSGYE